MVHELTVVATLKFLTLVLGGLITYFAYKAYRRTGGRSLGLLAAGFAVVTVGALAGGVLDQATSFDFNVALIVQSAFTVVGFAIILYSLYTE